MSTLIKRKQQSLCYYQMKGTYEQINSTDSEKDITQSQTGQPTKKQTYLKTTELQNI